MAPEYLFTKAFPISVGIIRATTADADGNLTIDVGALTPEALAIAMAARNSGGVVIAQVRTRRRARLALNPRQVKVPVYWSMRSWSPPIGPSHTDLR